jgi:hypothetical protein
VVVHDRRADLVEAELLDPLPDSFEIGGLLAIELKEGGDVFDRFFLRRDVAEQVGRADMWMS